MVPILAALPCATRIAVVANGNSGSDAGFLPIRSSARGIDAAHRARRDARPRAGPPIDL